MIRKTLGILVFIVTGVGLLVSTLIKDMSIFNIIVFVLIGIFFLMGLVEHFYELKTSRVSIKIGKKDIHILICSFIGVTFTWFINHIMGYGAVMASGIVGVTAAILLPAPLAGVVYTSSFIGMSATAVIPSFIGVALAGMLVGIIIISTRDIYAGIGGKGGTTAAFATILIKAVLELIK